MYIHLVVIHRTHTHIFYIDLILFCLFEDFILKIIRSNEPSIIQKYLEDYLILLQNRMNQYKIELTTQALSCPVTLITQSTMSLEIIDQKLNEFVRLHHLNLERHINYHISKLRGLIREKQLVQELSSYPLTNEQVIITYLYV